MADRIEHWERQMNENITFSRMLLTSIGPEVKAAGYRVNKDAWTYHYHVAFPGHYEFHGPDGYFDGSIVASNAYEARYIGWMRFLVAQKAADTDSDRYPSIHEDVS
tara:strand:+ start:110 stop:427 length:318 start_codon:yes stop_codon:yes gene_type:complete